MRRRRAEKRELIPDIKYNSELVARMINFLMERGKKSTAQRIIYEAMEKIGQKKQDAEPLEIFLQAIENVKPQLEVKSRRVGGATYQVPVEIRPERQVALALRWILNFSRGKKGAMSDTLASELLEAYENTGNAVKKRDDTHRMAAANRAFAHFRW